MGSAKTQRRAMKQSKPVALVTGGTKGIGAAVVGMLIGRGYRVIATYAHDDEAARRLCQQWGDDVVTCRSDQSLRAETYKLVEFVREQAACFSGSEDTCFSASDDGDSAGRGWLQCVVCNAGLTIRKSFLDTTDTDWDSMMECSLVSNCILLRELYPLIADGARIIFTGSAMGIHPHATVVGYGVAKSAVHALTKNLVKVFEPKHVTVNAIAPGFVETEWQRNKPDDVRRNICRKTAIHRFATTDEVAAAFAFCLDNGYVNGSVIEVDGGYQYQ